MRNAASRSASRLARAATHAGQDLVWLIIAILFCFVEAAVKVTELVPRKRQLPRGATGFARTL